MAVAEQARRTVSSTLENREFNQATVGACEPAVRPDVVGELIRDWFDGQQVCEIVEREDAFVSVYGGPAAYFLPWKDWKSSERRAVRYARGQVLDVGAGAGRVALELENRGRRVVAIDRSPLAVEVARARGVGDARVHELERIDELDERFDSIVLFSAGLGLLGNRERAVATLRAFGDITSERGKVIASCTNPWLHRSPASLSYYRENLRRGRLYGQLTIRIRYGNAASPWFDWLNASPEEVAVIAAEAGWRLARVIGAHEGTYSAVLCKRAGRTDGRPPVISV